VAQTFTVRKNRLPNAVFTIKTECKVFYTVVSISWHYCFLCACAGFMLPYSGIDRRGAGKKEPGFVSKSPADNRRPLHYR
jgi:hypothetical protein